MHYNMQIQFHSFLNSDELKSLRRMLQHSSKANAFTVLLFVLFLLLLSHSSDRFSAVS